MNSKILIVEDDPSIATALGIRLRHAGYDVINACDGHEGLQSAITLKPDLIISDIWMPGAVGFLMAERLNAFDLGSIPLIFITANKRKHLVRLAKEVGAFAFFEKPYDPDELLKAVADALKCRRVVSAGKANRQLQAGSQRKT
jgi:CheY-like chemotaxis protein